MSDAKKEIPLRVCPWCRKTPEICHPEHALIDYNKKWSVVCGTCSLYFGYDPLYGGMFDTEEEAAEAWNKWDNAPLTRLDFLRQEKNHLLTRIAACLGRIQEMETHREVFRLQLDYDKMELKEAEEKILKIDAEIEKEENQ